MQQNHITLIREDGWAYLAPTGSHVREVVSEVLERHQHLNSHLSSEHREETPVGRYRITGTPQNEAWLNNILDYARRKLAQRLNAVNNTREEGQRAHNTANTKYRRKMRHDTPISRAEIDFVNRPGKASSYISPEDRKNRK